MRKAIYEILAMLIVLADASPLLGAAPPATPSPTSFGEVVQHTTLMRDGVGCVSATWLTLSDGGAQSALLAADGGMPVNKMRYMCTATQDGCFVQDGNLLRLGTPTKCSFAATFFASSSTFEQFYTTAADAGMRIVGMGVNANTTFTCCPYTSVP
jgi:hypothetical protein